MSEPAIHVDRVVKSFGNQPVLKEVSFSVPAGQTLALLGRNGAGKTSDPCDDGVDPSRLRNGATGKTRSVDCSFGSARSGWLSRRRPNNVRLDEARRAGSISNAILSVLGYEPSRELHGPFRNPSTDTDLSLIHI